MYYLTKFDGVIIQPFLTYSKKITPANLCKPIHDIINCFSSICPLKSGKCRKQGGKFEYLDN